jgi:phage terminase large subunit
MTDLALDLPTAFEPLLQPFRYKILHGGRGSAKSWSAARALTAFAYSQPERILCVREFQNSIADSVHRLIADQIFIIGVQDYFTITQSSIFCNINGSEFLFKGLRHNANEIKSTEGITKCWVEEAQRTSKESWDFLIPTIRTPKSEIWATFNLEDDDSATSTLFLKRDPPNSFVRKVTWRDNPHFPETLDIERRYMQRVDPDAYDHVWEGFARRVSDAQVFGKRVEIATFTAPPGARLLFGSDFGFANDPTTLIRSFIKDDSLFIEYEAFGYGVEIDDTPALYETVPDARKWPIKADNARPETISYLMRQGFRISAAEKWKGSVEDGIAHLKGFKKIVIHERCKRMQQEARLYSYKVDQRQLDGDGQPVVLPQIVDAHNHGWDAVRYSLDGYIQHRGGMGVWMKLNK